MQDALEQSKEVSTADAASQLLIGLDQQAADGARFTLDAALTKAEGAASQMENSLDTVPRAQLPAQMQRARIRAANCQSLLTYAKNSQALWVKGLPSSPPPSVDPTFDDVKNWLASGKIVPHGQLLDPVFVPRMTNLGKQYNGMVGELQSILGPRP